MNRYTVTGEVELFPQDGGWYHIVVPDWITDELSHLADRGLIPVRATVGPTTWDTSLLPIVNGRHFIALKALVRKTNDIEVGDQATIRFRVRDR